MLNFGLFAASAATRSCPPCSSWCMLLDVRDRRGSARRERSGGLHAASASGSRRSSSPRARSTRRSIQLSTRWPGATATAPVPELLRHRLRSSARLPDRGRDAAAVRRAWTTPPATSGSPRSATTAARTPNYWTDALLATPAHATTSTTTTSCGSVPRASSAAASARWSRSSRPRTCTLNFPRAALVAGHFETSNSGNKVIIDTNGEANQFSPGDIIVRCALTVAGCASYDSDKGQIEPDTIRSNPAQPRAVSRRGTRPVARARQGRRQLLRRPARRRSPATSRARSCSWRTRPAATTTATTSTTRPPSRDTS